MPWRPALVYTPKQTRRKVSHNLFAFRAGAILPEDTEGADGVQK